jgi:hypothetical protein
MALQMRRQKLALYLFLLATATSCDCNDDSGLPPDEVSTRTKPGVDFTAYKTFRINDEVGKGDLADAGVDVDDIPGQVLLNIDTANDQARMELEARGMTEVGEDEDADLVIFSLGSTQDQHGYYWECVPGYWWGYWGWVWDPCAWLAPIYVEYSIGSMVLGLADPSMEDVVFGGLLQGVAAGDNPEDRIRDGVHAMFKDYPVTATAQ